MLECQVTITQSVQSSSTSSLPLQGTASHDAKEYPCQSTDCHVQLAAIHNRGPNEGSPSPQRINAFMIVTVFFSQPESQTRDWQAERWNESLPEAGTSTGGEPGAPYTAGRKLAPSVCFELQVWISTPTT